MDEDFAAVVEFAERSRISPRDLLRVILQLRRAQIANHVNDLGEIMGALEDLEAVTADINVSIPDAISYADSLEAQIDALEEAAAGTDPRIAAATASLREGVTNLRASLNPDVPNPGPAPETGPPA